VSVCSPRTARPSGRSHEPLLAAPLVQGPETEHLLALAGLVTPCPGKTRWTIAILAVVAALAAALVAQLHDSRDSSARTQSAVRHPEPTRARTPRADTPKALAGPPAAGEPAALLRSAGGGPGPACFGGVVVECAADAAPSTSPRCLGRTQGGPQPVGVLVPLAWPNCRDGRSINDGSGPT